MVNVHGYGLGVTLDPQTIEYAGKKGKNAVTNGESALESGRFTQNQSKQKDKVK